MNDIVGDQMAKQLANRLASIRGRERPNGSDDFAELVLRDLALRHISFSARPAPLTGRAG